MSTLALRSATRRPAIGEPLLRRPTLAWVALFLNVLTFLHMQLLLPIPGPLGQAIAQGALPAAIVLAALANRRLAIRPNLLLALMTVMAVVALVVSIHSTFLIGGTFRAVRLLEFVVVLWLLTPWWGARDILLIRAHMLCLAVALGSVLVGALLAPSRAFNVDNEGRLTGVLWPITPPQVAHMSAVLLGCVAVIWFSGGVRGRIALPTVAAAGAMLIATHTRTALLGLLVGLVVAGASLFIGYARVRRTAGTVMIVAVLSGTFLAPLLTAWASRGQSTAQVYQLTGRTLVWTSVFAEPRPWFQQLFGQGLANKSFNGLAIDSSWVATYHELGWFGVALGACFLLIPLMTAVTHPPGLHRGLALFLLVYCLVSSFTETGLGDASLYLLEVVLAASLLAHPAERSSA